MMWIRFIRQGVNWAAYPPTHGLSCIRA